MRDGRFDEAAECCRRAFPRLGGDVELLRICAWTFSNGGCHDEAAATYRALIELCPEWVEGYRHRSGSLAASGRLDEAIADAMTACARSPDTAEYVLHLGGLLLGAERWADAARCFAHVLEAEPDDRLALCRLASAYERLGRSQDAAAIVLRVARLEPRDPAAVAHAAELLMRDGRAGDAAALLRDTTDALADARLLRVLSSAEMLAGRLELALEAVERAIAAAPSVAEYHVHRGHLLWRLGDMPGAAGAFEHAAALEPDSAEVKRAQISLYLSAGLVSEATSVGGELLHLFPDDKPAAEAVLHLLNHRLDTIDGDYVVLADGIAREKRHPRPPPGWLDRLRSERRVIGALIIRETRTRFGDSRLGYGWALIEPILHISLLSATFAVLMHGRPPIGTHFFVFYYTGLIPYLMFIHTSSGMSHAIVGNGALLQLPVVTTFTVIAARGLLEVMTDIVVAVILLAGFGTAGLAAMPDDLWGAASALLVTAMLGCGVGYINAVATVFYPSWEKLYGQVTRILYFVSGIFYVPGMMPDWARDTLAWNPLLHAIDWFRAGFFDGYQPHWLDRSYLVGVAVLVLAGGFAVERGLRRRLSMPL